MSHQDDDRPLSTTDLLAMVNLVDRVERQNLVDQHMSLVEAIATSTHRAIHRAIDRDELLSWGTTGLLEALERYDARVGARFATFAYYRIRGAIYDGLRKSCHLSPRQKRRVLAGPHASDHVDHVDHVERAGQRRRRDAPAFLPSGASVRRRNQSAASPSRGADEADQTAELRDPVNAVTRLVMVSFNEDQTVDERAGDERADALLAEKRLHARLAHAIASLPDKERFFIAKCYYDGKSIVEAGQELGLSKSWSSRLHARALQRLRDLLRSEVG